MNETAIHPRRRMIITVTIAIVLLALVVGFNIFKNIMIARYASSGTLPTVTVTTLKAEMQSWQPRLSAAPRAVWM